MEIQELVLKFEEKNDIYTFNEKVNLVEDEKLIKFLGRENVKNNNSSLIIKSMNNLPIFEVIQFKINVSEVGSFFFNFEKGKSDDKSREEILLKIGKLKDNSEPTKELQIKKVFNLFTIVKNYPEFYCAYIPNGLYKLSFEEIKNCLREIDLSFPTLYLLRKEKQYPQKEVAPGKLDFNFFKFSFDYVFVSIFMALCSFGIFTGTYQIANKQSIAAFLLVLAFVFFGVLSYCAYSTIYKNNKEEHSGLKYYLILFILIGIALGIGVAFVICKYAIKAEVETINYPLIFGVSIGVSTLLGIGSIFITKLIQIIVDKISK